MTIIQQKTENSNPQLAEQPSDSHTVCALGNELTDCPLRRVGCHSLYESLMYIWPPYTVMTWVKEHLSSDRDAQHWLQHLDNALPGQRTVRGGR